MKSDYEVRRRALATMYRRYLQADREWTMTLREMRLWYPVGARPYRGSIGDAGSAVRRAYERRARAIEQLQVAKGKLDAARRRHAQVREGRGRLLFLSLARV